MKKGAKLVLIASLIGAMATPVSANVYLGAGDLGNTYQNYRISNGISRYKYADIDGNGIVDMMFRKQDGLGVATYDYHTGKVVKVKSVSNTGDAPIKIYYKPGKRYFAWSYQDGTGGKYVLYKMYGTKATRNMVLSWKNYTAGGPVYKMNGNTVSRDKFDKKLHWIWSFTQQSFKNYYASTDTSTKTSGVGVNADTGTGKTSGGTIGLS